MSDFESIFNDLVRFQIELWNAVDSALRAEHDLPLGSFEALRIMEKRESCRVFDVADELIITVGGASKLVDRVEARGLCVRRSNPDDRRSSIVELTPAGRRLAGAALVTFEAELATRLAAPLGDKGIGGLAVALSTLRASSLQMSK